jgi:hypothetical protein
LRLENDPNSTETTNKSSSTTAPDSTNKQQVPYDYIDDIYENLILEEREMEGLFGYMTRQTDLTEKMRAILVDWLIEVHFKFKLSQETLFLCTYLIDKYLSKILISKNKLQLVGISALLIACKYEEIFSPELRDFVYVTDKAYTKEEILALETDMLAILKFDITVPSSLKFFQILAQNLDLGEKETSLGYYLLELFLLDYRSLKYKPSVTSASVAYLVSKIFKKNSHNKIFEFFEYEKNLLKECAKDIIFLHENIESTQLVSVKRKFMSEKFFQVAKIKII